MKSRIVIGTLLFAACSASSTSLLASALAQTPAALEAKLSSIVSDVPDWSEKDTAAYMLWDEPEYREIHDHPCEYIDAAKGLIVGKGLPETKMLLLPYLLAQLPTRDYLEWMRFSLTMYQKGLASAHFVRKVVIPSTDERVDVYLASDKKQVRDIYAALRGQFLSDTGDSISSKRIVSVANDILSGKQKSDLVAEMKALNKPIPSVDLDASCKVNK